jgi:hypothetical protein
MCREEIPHKAIGPPQKAVCGGGGVGFGCRKGLKGAAEGERECGGEEEREREGKREKEFVVGGALTIKSVRPCLFVCRFRHCRRRFALGARWTNGRKTRHFTVPSALISVCDSGEPCEAFSLSFLIFKKLNGGAFLAF